MRGYDGMQETLFTMAKLEDFAPADHLLREIGILMNEALERLNGPFNALGRDIGLSYVAAAAG